MLLSSDLLFNKLPVRGKLCALLPTLFVENNLKHSDPDRSIHSRFAFGGREGSTDGGAFQWPDTSGPFADEHFEHCALSLCAIEILALRSEARVPAAKRRGARAPV